MKRRWIPLLILAALSTMGVGEGIGEWRPPDAGGGSVNIATDTDSDGLPDRVEVGDYDGDGTLETADIASAVAALTDTGGKYVFVLPGTYVGPAAALAGTRSLIVLESDTTFECAGADSVTIYGAAWVSGANGATVDRAVIGNTEDDAENNIAVINCGFDGGSKAGWYFDFGDASTGSDTIELEYWVGNDLAVDHDDHYYETGTGPIQLVEGTAALPTCTPACAAATDYWVIRVDADTIKLASSLANALAGTAVDITAQGTGTNHQMGLPFVAEGITQVVQMGLLFRGVDHLTIRGNKVRNTMHTGIYVSSGEHTEVSQNEVQLAGNYGNIDATSQQAGLYLFASNTHGPMDRILVNGNRMIRVATAYNTRGDDPRSGEDVKYVLFSDNTVTGAQGACFALRSIRTAQVVGANCDDSASFLVLENSTTGYLDQDAVGAGGDPALRSQKIRFFDVHATNLLSTTTSAIQIGDYHDGVFLGNVSVDRSVKSCMGINTPSRGVVLDGVELSNCGETGIAVTGAAPTNPYEGLTFRNVTVNGVDQFDGVVPGTGFYGLFWSGVVADYTIMENVSIYGVNNRPIRLAGGARMKWTNITVNCRPPRLRGPMVEATANTYVCNAGTKFDILWVTNATNTADCTFASGAATDDAWCQCNGDGTYTAITQGGTIPDMDGIFNSAAIDDSEFTNITSYDCTDEYTFGGTGAITDSVFTGIKAYADPAFFNGAAHNPPHGALEIPASSSNVLIDQRGFQCVNTDAAQDCVLTAEDDLAVGSLFMDDTCDAPCTNVTTCIDNNEAVVGNLSQCQAALWVVK